MELLAVKTLASLLVPPGLFVSLLLAVPLLRPSRRVGAYCVVVALVLWVLATPRAAQALLAGLDHYPPLSPAALERAEAVVILSGDRYRALAPDGRDEVGPATLERLRFGAGIARESGLPVLVTGGVVSGGGTPVAQLMADALQDFGVEARWVESASRTTRENAAFSASLLRGSGVTRLVLVTHFWHQPRAVAAFRARGFEVAPAPAYAPQRSGEGPSALSFLPSADALAHSAAALHEYLGMAWYRLRYAVAFDGPGDR